MRDDAQVRRSGPLPAEIRRLKVFFAGWSPEWQFALRRVDTVAEVRAVSPDGEPHDADAWRTGLGTGEDAALLERDWGVRVTAENRARRTSAERALKRAARLAQDTDRAAGG